MTRWSMVLGPPVDGEVDDENDRNRKADDTSYDQQRICKREETGSESIGRGVQWHDGYRRGGCERGGVNFLFCSFNIQPLPSHGPSRSLVGRLISSWISDHRVVLDVGVGDSIVMKRRATKFVTHTQSDRFA